MYKMGIDVGAFSIQAAVLTEDHQLIYKSERTHHKKIKETAIELIRQISRDLSLKPEEEVCICATGSMVHLLNLPAEAIVSENAAISGALTSLVPQAASFILLGAQRTLYAFKPDGVHMEIKKNTNCSAGTGAFFEEQASRLNLELSEISSVVSKAKSVPVIAGRCSVFSKTDMIHRMQEGTATSDILLGLCYALVRNFRASILRNQKPAAPVYLAGGVMKNEGVIRALKDLLSLEENDIILDENSDYPGAIGAALKAAPGKFSINTRQLTQKIEAKTITEEDDGLPCLIDFCRDGDFPEYETVPYIPGEETFLGIDIGSTSINLVLLNQSRKVIYYSYVKTLGKPLDIVRKELKKLHECIPALLSYKISVTGSGREYIGKEIEADLVINEITAQTEGALMSHPGTDTVFEIGGQDSKYMSCRDGKMIDFEMNKVCAAGTGAFLEEQIAKLGISMKEFITLALHAKHPCQLGNRCSVFIEGSVNQAFAAGHCLEDVCAGLAYAIASNYLYRVVNRKVIGENIAIQGGIAYNQAVVCAFRAITKKEIHVSPYFAVTGAMGAAGLLLNKSYLKFDTEKNRRLNQILTEKTEESYLMDYQLPALDGRKKVVGVPRVVFLHKMFPLFNALFTNLGYEVLISPLSDESIVKKAGLYASAETCYPIKLIYGHIAWLLENRCDIIVLPRLYTIKHEGSVARKDYACMYMQSSPLLMEQAFHFEQRGVKLIMPELSLSFGKKYMLESILSIGPQLGISKVKMLPAAASAFAKLVAHSKRLETIGKESLAGEEPIFVLISRVYNIIDPILNMGIEQHLNKIGCRVVHLEHLQASVMNVEHDYPDLYWPFGQHILTGLKIVKAHKNMYPIYITNHGCGPDTALQHFFREEMNGREYLHLEVDEHTSKVGVITRLEAFLYSLREQKEEGKEKISYGNGGCNGCSACSDQGKGVDLCHFEKILIPDYGIYSDVLEKYVRKEIEGDSSAPIPEIIRVKPLLNHKTFDYAMNKEYYSMLIMLEELLVCVRKNTSYVLVAPIDEGSEVFGQYALLCTKELNRAGFNVTLCPFYLEDLIKREDYQELYQDMIEAEKNDFVYVTGQEKNSSLYVMGEPMCIYKSYIRERNLKEIPNADFTIMPFSEALLFHMMEIDRKQKLVPRIQKWKSLHDDAMHDIKGEKLYSKTEELFGASKGRLDFLIGDFGKYRFAKLLCLSLGNTDAAVLLNSAEENTAIILKQILESYRSKISVPYTQCDLDYEHILGKEDIELLISEETKTL